MNQKVSVIRGKHWMKPVVVILLTLIMFSTSVQVTGVVASQAMSNDESVEAVGFIEAIKNGWDALDNWRRDIFGDEEVATVMTNEEYDGTTWVITPPEVNGDTNYSTAGWGMMNVESGSEAPFELDNLSKDSDDDTEDGDATGTEAAKMYMSFQYWASEYGVYSLSGSNFMINVLRDIGRAMGGLGLFLTSLFGRIVQLFGQLVYEAIDTFNVFKYITPDSTSGNLLSEWSYNSDNQIMSYFADWLNFGRLFGYILAVLLFVSGLALSVLGFRIGKSQSMSGSVMSTFKRLVVSVFALTGAVFMLSGMITTFADKMQAGDDELDINEQISGLILDYKGYVTSGYAFDDEGTDAVDNNTWQINSSGIDAGTADDVKSLQAIEFMYSNNSTVDMSTAATLSDRDIRNMNAISGAYTGSDDTDETTSIKDYIIQFLNFEAMDLIIGWSTSNLTSSDDMAATYGEESMPYAIYRVHTSKPGILTVEDSGFFSTKHKYYDYTLPGGIGGFVRYLGVIGNIGIVSAFALVMYGVMFRSIMTMVQNVILWFPSGVALGSIGGLSMLFGAVISMIAQLTIARIMIALFKDVLLFTGDLFPSLDSLTNTSDGGLVSGMITPISELSTGPFNFGAITPFGAGAGTESVGNILLSAILLWVVGIVLFKQFVKLNAKMGSSVSQFFTDMASRISGVRMGENGLSGNGGSMNSDGSFESTTTTESDQSSSTGSFSESDASQMGLSGSIIGGIGGGPSTSGAFSSGMGEDSDYSSQSEEDAQNEDRLRENLTPESALASGSVQSANEQALGGVGGGSDVGEDEIETTSSDSSTSGSSVSSMGDESALDDENMPATGEESLNGGINDGTSGYGRHDNSVGSKGQDIDGSATSGISDDDNSAIDDLDSERTINGTESVHVNQDQDFDTIGNNADMSMETAQSDADMDGQDVDRDIAGNNLAYNRLGDDASVNATGSQMDDPSSVGADAAMHSDNMSDMDGEQLNDEIVSSGDDRNLQYVTDAGNQSMEESGDGASGYDLRADGADVANDNYAVGDMNEMSATDDENITQQVGQEDQAVNIDSQFDDMNTEVRSDATVDDGNMDDVGAYNTDDVDQSYDGSIMNMSHMNTSGDIDQENQLDAGSDDVQVAAMDANAYDADSDFQQDVPYGNVNVTDQSFDTASQQDIERNVSGMNDVTSHMDQTGSFNQSNTVDEGFNDVPVSEDSVSGYNTQADVQQSSPYGNVNGNDQSSATTSDERVVSDVSGMDEQSIQMDQMGHMNHSQHIQEGGDQLDEYQTDINTFQDDLRPTSNPNTVSGYNRSLSGNTSDSEITATMSGQDEENITVNEEGTMQHNQSVASGASNMTDGYSTNGASTPAFGRVANGMDNDYQNGYTTGANQEQSRSVADPYQTASNEPSYSGSIPDNSAKAVGAQQSHREGQFDTSNTHTKSTTTTKYTPPTQRARANGANGSSRLGTPVEGGYIDNDGNFQPTSNSALGGDLSSYFGGGGNSTGAVPRSSRMVNAPSNEPSVSGASEDVSVKRRPSKKTKRETTSSSFSSGMRSDASAHYESSYDVSGGNGFFSETSDYDTTFESFADESFNTDSTTDGPKFGRRE